MMFHVPPQHQTDPAKAPGQVRYREKDTHVVIHDERPTALKEHQRRAETELLELVVDSTRQ